MAGFISEFFGYRASDRSEEALSVAAKKTCPFTGGFCTKLLSRERIASGVCAVRQKRRVLLMSSVVRSGFTRKTIRCFIGLQKVRLRIN